MKEKEILEYCWKNHYLDKKELDQYIKHLREEIPNYTAVIGELSKQGVQPRKSTESLRDSVTSNQDLKYPNDNKGKNQHNKEAFL